MTRTIRAVQALALLLAALTMGLEFAHVLELGPRFGYPAALYVQLTNTLYFWFGTVGQRCTSSRSPRRRPSPGSCVVAGEPSSR